MPGAKDIKRRIKSVGNTKKITKAMEMVAAAKMRRAIEAVLRTRTYANLSWGTVLNLARVAGGDEPHPLLAKREKVEKVGIVLFASNRGLCGGFNSGIINKAHASIKKHHRISSNDKIEADFIVMGKKGLAVYKYFGYNIAAEFPKEDVALEIKEIVPLAKIIIGDYLAGKYDKIMVAYTDFVNPGKQVPRVKQLLPVDISSQDKYLGVVGQSSLVGVDREYIEMKQDKHLSDDEFVYEYVFEPNPREVLDEMIPRLLEIQLYQALLESNASEHSARMNAMHQAHEAAGDMIGELTLSYNKARQAAITREIAEISAGANALK